MEYIQILTDCCEEFELICAKNKLEVIKAESLNKKTATYFYDATDLFKTINLLRIQVRIYEERLLHPNS